MNDTPLASPELPNNSSPPKRNNKIFYCVFLCAVAGFIYLMLTANHQHNSGLIYLGLPLLLAVGFASMPGAKSASGAAVRGTTIVLLLSAPVFKEGWLCICLACPFLQALPH